MNPARTRVLGALVAVVLAASGVAGLGAFRADPSVASSPSVATRQALTTDVVLSAEAVRADKVEARRLLTDHLGVVPAPRAGLTEPSIIVASGRVTGDATPPPGLAFGRAPPSSR